MRTHVFIVNDKTFPSHLQYLFAGTGNKDCDWDPALLADISRIRVGDCILFYIESNKKSKGGFYGIFRVAEYDPPVLHVTGNNALRPNLAKKLIFRVRIEPFEVYAEGVAEWEALDILPLYASEIQWSLIYRKLKGGRGCTPLFPWEAEILANMIRDKNGGTSVDDTNYTGGFDWDISNRRIITSQQRSVYQQAGALEFNPLEAICHIQTHHESFDKHLQNTRGYCVQGNYKKCTEAYEHYLQLYFSKNIGIDSNLDEVVGSNVLWFGNEVYCGVGMQKMDIVTICQNKDRKEYRLVELKYKAVEPESIIEQIEYYVNWGSGKSGRHLKEAFEWNIQPVIVATPYKSNKLSELSIAFKRFNDKKISLPIRYFEFTVGSDISISFAEVNY